jgi:hypothetical protein
MISQETLDKYHKEKKPYIGRFQFVVGQPEMLEIVKVEDNGWISVKNSDGVFDNINAVHVVRFRDVTEQECQRWMTLKK